MIKRNTVIRSSCAADLSETNLIEEDYPFTCPHCGVDLSARLDITGGNSQSFIQDCETCCRLIQITVKFEDGEVIDFSVEATE